ncbi:MAG: hypothetical protein AB1498_07780 [bacterium]
MHNKLIQIMNDKTISGFPGGTVRVGLGYFNTEDDIQYLISSLKMILRPLK